MESDSDSEPRLTRMQAQAEDRGRIYQVGQGSIIITEAPPAAMRVVPAQLPADVDAFTGRTQELAYLDRMLASTTEQTAAGGDSTAVVISVISGTAGVGKTALALRWAHGVRNEFPDGQLHMNLRGYDPDQPVSAGDALAGFLRALGVASRDIPLEEHECAALYRSLLAGRRMLVLLDNAASVEQLRPLLPGSSTCLVLVTSRDSLAGLVARHGARRLDLDLLPPGEAIGLLRTLIDGRVEAEHDAAAVLAEQCARLPLALRVAAELVATHPATSLAALVKELADQQRRLELLDAGEDPRTAVRAVLSWSYQHLPADAARAFRLIGLHPSPDFDSYAAAALTATSLRQARRLLELLTRAHLVQSTITDRYSMHDLLRAYATHMATAEDSKSERWAALTQLFDHYLATAAVALDTLIPSERHRRPLVQSPATPTPPVSEPSAAQGWLDTERFTLTSACAFTATHDWPGHTIRMAAVLFRYLEVGGHYADALTIHTHALHAAERLGDSVAEARALTNLGIVHEQQSRYHQAAEHQQRALALSRRSGDHRGQARAQIHLGVVCWRQGHYALATDYLHQALALYREIADRVGEATALTCLGIVCLWQSHYEPAADYLHQALTLTNENRDRVGEIRVLTALGVVYQRQRRYEQATEHHQLALALSRKTNNRGGEARALNGIGETHYATGQPHEAVFQHNAALNLALQIGDRSEQARAHDGLAHAYHSIGNLAQAHQHWHHTLDLYTALGVPEVDDIRTHLATLKQPEAVSDEPLLK